MDPSRDLVKGVLLNHHPVPTYTTCAWLIRRTLFLQVQYIATTLLARHSSLAGLFNVRLIELQVTAYLLFLSVKAPIRSSKTTPCWTYLLARVIQPPQDVSVRRAILLGIALSCCDALAFWLLPRKGSAARMLSIGNLSDGSNVFLWCMIPWIWHVAWRAALRQHPRYTGSYMGDGASINSNLQDESHVVSETASDEEVHAMLDSLQHEALEDVVIRVEQENTSEPESNDGCTPRSKGRRKLWSLDKLMPPPPPHFDFGPPSSESEGEEDEEQRPVHSGKENCARVVGKNRTKSRVAQVASSPKQFNPSITGGVPTPFLRAALNNVADVRRRSPRLSRVSSNRTVDSE